MKQVTYHRDLLIKVADLKPFYAYRILSAQNLVTRYGESVLLHIRDDISQNINAIYQPKR